MSGIFNKALKNTFSKEDDVDIEYRVFDLLFEDEWDSKKCNRAYSKRRQQLVNIFERTMINTTEDLSNIHLVKDYIVENEDELFELFNHVYKQGNEGLIIKSSNSKYSFKRSYDWMKLKGENECDLKIVQVNLGEGKRKGLIGSLTCCSNDNKLKVDVGSGFNDKELEYLTSIKDELVGKIITVKYNEIINNKDNEYSLFLPIFIELRTDKTEADNIEKIMSECNLSEL